MITTTLQNCKPFMKVIGVGQMRSYFFTQNTKFLSLTLFRYGAFEIMPGLEPGTFACEANVITSTLQNHDRLISVLQMTSSFFYCKCEIFIINLIYVSSICDSAWSPTRDLLHVKQM